MESPKPLCFYFLASSKDAFEARATRRILRRIMARCEGELGSGPGNFDEKQERAARIARVDPPDLARDGKSPGEASLHDLSPSSDRAGRSGRVAGRQQTQRNRSGWIEAAKRT